MGVSGFEVDVEHGRESRGRLLGLLGEGGAAEHQQEAQVRGDTEGQHLDDNEHTQLRRDKKKYLVRFGVFSF